MLIRSRYSLKDLIMWTRKELFIFFIYSLCLTTLYAIFDIKALHVPWTPLALIGTAVAFVVGFQNNAAYERTWEARKIWGGIVNTSRTLAMQINDFIRESGSNETTDQLKEVQRTLILRHVGWLTSLRHAMRESRPWETNYQHKTDKEWRDKISTPEAKSTIQKDLSPYLPSSEFDYVMTKGNKSTTLLFLQSRHIRKLKEQGMIWEFAFLELEKTLSELFNLQGKSERIKNFPYPRQYSTISHWFIWIFLMLIPLGLIAEFQEIGVRLSETIPTAEFFFVWMAVPFCTLVSWVFHTMERIGRVGENPFEGGPNDVPISTIARGIEIDILQQHNFDSNKIAKPFEEEFFVQM